MTGSLSRESTDIALVLDPPLPEEPDEASAAIRNFLIDIDEVQWSEPGRGWLLVSASLIRAHDTHAVQIYSRSTYAP
jgi:hypothetical protein